MCRIRSRRMLAKLAVVALTLVSAACASEENSRSTLTIGLLIPLSGTYQTVGADLRDGFQQYLEDHDNQLGGHPVTLAFADEGDSASTAAAAATKLVEQDKALVVTGIGSSVTASTAIPIITAANITVIGSSSRPALQDISRVWHTSYLAYEPGTAIAEYIRDTVSGSIFAIGPDSPGGWDQVRGFTTTFLNAGGRLANPEGKATFTPFPATTNFTPYFTQIVESGATAVYCFYAGSSAIDFVKQYAASDLRELPLYAAGFLTEGAVLTAQGDAAKGIYTVLNYSPDLNNETNRSFVADWREKHTSTPTTYAMSSFDAAAILDRAIDAAGDNPTSDQINTEIGRLGRVESPRGTWQMSQTTHTPIQKWYLRQVRLDGNTVSNVIIEELATIGA